MSHFEIIARTAVATLISVIAVSVANAQSYPTKPIRIVVGGAPGSSIDLPTRVIADRLKDRLGQAVIVENRPAAGGTVAANEGAKSAPDGHVLYMGFNGPLAFAPHLFSSLPYDPIKDFAPVIKVGSQPFVLAVPTSLEVKTLQAFIELARRQPGKLNYSSLGNGSGTHITMELLKSRGKVFIVHIPYNGGPAAATAIAQGDAQAFFAPIATIMPHVRSGRATLIAVSSKERFALMPDVPTVAEQGFPEFDSDGWNGFVAPAATPRAVIDRLNKEINEIFALPEVRQFFTTSQIKIGGGTPEEFGALMRTYHRDWAGVIKASGAKLD